MKTLLLQRWKVRRASLKRLKQGFDNKGIGIPFPHFDAPHQPQGKRPDRDAGGDVADFTLYAGQPKQETAAPFQVHGTGHAESGGATR